MNIMTNKQILKKIKPMALEGRVIRISDVVEYIGKDIEDAIIIGVVDKNQIPNEIITVLGQNNSPIVNTIVIDIIKNSIGKNYIKLSSALKQLIKNIYQKANSNEELEQYKLIFNSLFDLYYNQILNNCKNEDIYTLYLNEMNDEYINNNSIARIVIDYMSGMTYNFFCSQFKKYFK